MQDPVYGLPRIHLLGTWMNSVGYCADEAFLGQRGDDRRAARCNGTAALVVGGMEANERR
jgi:hypothetical protein